MRVGSQRAFCVYEALSEAREEAAGCLILANQDVMTTGTRTVFTSPDQETFVYASDGNLTSDGRWDYVLDAENRVIQMPAKAYALPDSARKQLVFSYDFMGRRVQKVVSTGTAKRRHKCRGESRVNLEEISVIKLGVPCGIF